MVDIAASSHVDENLEHPLGPALYTASIFHCMTVSLANHGPGLGTMWGEQTALELLSAAGFHHVEIKRVEADFLNSYYVARKTVMVPSLDGLAPFQIGFVVRDLERAAHEFDARLAAGPWRGWVFGPQGQGREYRGRPSQPPTTTPSTRSASSSKPSNRPPR